MSAKDRARLKHWDIDPQVRHKRDPEGLRIQEEIKRWNQEAAILNAMLDDLPNKVRTSRD